MNKNLTYPAHFRNFLVLLAFILTTGLNAQNFEFGVFAGASSYSGDLNPKDLDGYLKTLNPSFGGFLRFTDGPVAGRLSLNYLKVSGDDKMGNYPNRMLQFETNIAEFALTGEWLPFNIYPGRGDFSVSPYLFAGLAVFHFNPQSYYQGNKVELQPLGTEGQGLPGYNEKYSLNQIAIPMGGGIRFAVGDNWMIGMELSGRKLFTDYLDDVSGAEVVYQDVLDGNGPVAAYFSRPSFEPDTDDPLKSSPRGNKAKDWYYLGGITISYIFSGDDFLGGGRGGSNIGCPTF